MKYIIMCSSEKNILRHLSKIHGETLLERTLRLLLDSGVYKEDICFTISEALGNIVLEANLLPKEMLKFNYTKHGLWCDCFVRFDEPCTYLFGDVVYSPAAIKTIVETDTRSIEFFASAPPFARNYSKQWAEPFAFKVEDTWRFFRCIDKLITLYNRRVFNRSPIAWELWQVIRFTPFNKIDYTNYTVINDYTCDIDELDDVLKFEGGEKWHTI